MNDINIFVFICFDIFFLIPILSIFHPVRPHVCFHTCAMDLKGWQDTKRRQNIEVSIDYLQNIQVSNSIVYIHTACVIDNISVYNISLMCSLLSAWGYTCSAATLKQTRDTTRVWQDQRRFFSHETQKMTRLFLTEERRISTSDKSKITQIHTSNSTKART